jgi:hypothetical protein
MVIFSFPFYNNRKWNQCANLPSYLPESSNESYDYICQVFRGLTTKVNRFNNRFCNKTIIYCKTHCDDIILLQDFYYQFCNKNKFCNKLLLYENWYKDDTLNIIMLIFLYKDWHAMSSFIKLIEHCRVYWDI